MISSCSNLDRRDDVTHRAGARRVEGGQQRGVRARRTVDSATGEHVVVRVEQGPPAGVEMAPAHEPLGIRGRGRVERAGRRRPPVDEQRLQVVVEQPEAANEHPGAVGGVGAAEAQPIAAGTHPAQPRGLRAHRRLPQYTFARRAARPPLGGQQLALRGGPLGVETVVQKGDVAAVLIHARQFRSSSGRIVLETRSPRINGNRNLLFYQRIPGCGWGFPPFRDGGAPGGSGGRSGEHFPA
jgi:hypothetical protein